MNEISIMFLESTLVGCLVGAMITLTIYAIYLVVNND